jgi:hypothetical protein
MDRRKKVELFEQIRRGYAAGETIKGLAKKHGVHRRMVRQAIAGAIPPERKKPVRRNAFSPAGSRCSLCSLGRTGIEAVGLS